MAGNLPIDGRRLRDDLMRLAEITDPDKPYTRRSLSENRALMDEFLALKSHAPEEWAEPDALAAGTAVIAEALLRFDHGM